MDLSGDLKDYLVREFRAVASGIAGLEPTLEHLPDAAYLYSAVFGAVSRVLNISYSAELALLFLVTNTAHGMINARVNEVITGKNSAIGMPTNLFPRLADITGQLADRIERDEPYLDLLEATAALAGVTTGNGFYLFKTRGVGL